eukprot:2240377-Prymnesium_polylepis.1
MQLVAGMMDKAHITVPELAVVPKSHDDLFLRCGPSHSPTPITSPPTDECSSCVQSCQHVHRRKGVCVWPALLVQLHRKGQIRPRDRQG